DRTLFVDRLTQYVHDPTQSRYTDRHLDGFTAIHYFQPTTQTVGGAHGDATNDAATDLLLNFQHQTLTLTFADDLDCVVHLGHGILRELDVHHSADDLDDETVTHVKSSKPLITLALHRSSTGYDLCQFLGNTGLTGLVVHQLQVVNQVAGVVSRGLHGNHSGCLFTCQVFYHPLVYLRFDIA